MKRLLIGISLYLLLGHPVPAQGPVKPRVWMSPPAMEDGRCLRELFTHPDEWKETRAHVQVLGYADHMLNKQFTDDELRAWLPIVDRWGLKLGLEVGAVKPWGMTGEATFRAQRPMWDRFRSLGGRIAVLAMDEPLCCVRNDLKRPASYAVEQTAEFIALVRQYDPDIEIGDIETYPSLSFDELVTWIDALQSRLREKHVRGLDFFRLDVDWVHFTLGNGGGWKEVRRLEMACRERKLPFSLIYWAADYPHLQRLGLADDATWYISVMRQGQDYAIAEGSPDEYVIESWVGAPSHVVPETDEWSFTRSVLDFSRKFARGAH